MAVDTASDPDFDCQICIEAERSRAPLSEIIPPAPLVDGPSVLEGENADGTPVPNSTEFRALATVQTPSQTQTPAKSLAEPAPAPAPIRASICATKPVAYWQPHETGKAATVDPPSSVQAHAAYDDSSGCIYIEIHRDRATCTPTALKRSGMPIITSADVPYAAAIISHMYVAADTCPDIPFATQTLFQFTTHPLNTHWTVVTHFPHYPKSTAALTHAFGSTIQGLIRYLDTDWAQSPFISSTGTTTTHCASAGNAAAIFADGTRPPYSHPAAHLHEYDRASRGSVVIYKAPGR